MSPDPIQTRRTSTRALLGRVQTALLEKLGDNHESLLGTHTTIYATGSCGRGDMGAASDLDPYVVRVDGAMPSARSNVDADLIAAALRQAVKQVGLLDLDADGEYARLVTAESLFENLGNVDDDKTGAFTKRMLLLLESRPLVGESAYVRLVEQTIDAYWKNEEQHRADYLPIVLLNDIVRYWRIVLLNHESRLRDKSKESPLSPDEKMALRRYSSYKLRVPRCLSCFSALAYLLALTPTEPAHVKREDIFRMVGMSPIERLEQLQGKPNTSTEILDILRQLYVAYLERTDNGKKVLIDQLKSDPTMITAVSQDGKDFTRHMFQLIQTLGGGRTLHRAIVV